MYTSRNTFGAAVGRLCPVLSTADSNAGFFFLPNLALRNIINASCQANVCCHTLLCMHSVIFKIMLITNYHYGYYKVLQRILNITSDIKLYKCVLIN